MIIRQPNRYLGYAGAAYIDADVKVLAITPEPGRPPEAPTYENVARATYPLSRLIYVNCNRAPGKPLNPALDEFLRFILSREGQQIVRDQGIYVPLRAHQVTEARSLLTK